MKEACESDWLRRNGSDRRTRFGCSSKERLRRFRNQPALEPSKRPAL